MEFEKVESSNIEGVSYSEGTETVYVKFKNGTVYEYEGVPISIYLDLMESDSKGKFFNSNIKNAGFKYRKVV